MKKQIAAVSGAHGFIGTHLVSTLQKKGYKVVAIPRELLFKGPLLYEFFQRNPPSYIYHLAAYGNHNYQNDANSAILTNIGATFALLEATKMFPYEGFVNVSTSSVLLPNETYYSATKAGAERICKAFAQANFKPVVSVRPYSVYGPGEADIRFIPTVIKSITNGEEFKLAKNAVHDWLYVEDFITYLIKICTEAQNLTGGVFEIGTGVSTTNAEVVRVLEHVIGKQAKYIAVDQMRSYDTTEWVCKNPIEQPTPLPLGLLKTYDYYKQKLKA